MTCYNFRLKKQRSWYSSISNIFKGFINSIKNNDWKYLKEATTNELQD